MDEGGREGESRRGMKEEEEEQRPRKNCSLTFQDGWRPCRGRGGARGTEGWTERGRREGGEERGGEGWGGARKERVEGGGAGA